MDAPLTGNVFTDAALIMGLGMVTIFTILLLIVWIGQSLIRLVNRYVPAPEAHIQASTLPEDPMVISLKTIAAIVSTVAFVSGQKGKITSIEKLN